MITLLLQHQLLTVLLVGLIGIDFYIKKLEMKWGISINDL